MYLFDFSIAIRKKIVLLLSTLTEEQLNKIPEGFNNNLVWHLGHLVVSTPLLCYVRTGVDPEKLVPFADLYRNGTKPTKAVLQDDIYQLLSLLISTITDIQKDYAKGVFSQTQEYSTHTFGINLKNFEEVLACCAMHDSVHWGNILAIVKLV